VTGSGLYLRGIWNQLSDLPEVPEATVAKVRRWSTVLGVPRLHRVLAGWTPSGRRISIPMTGTRDPGAGPSPGHRTQGLGPAQGGAVRSSADWRVLVVLSTREKQRTRVALRVAQQMKDGWPEEVARLLAAGHRADLEALRPLGYLDLVGRAEGICHR